MSLQDDRTVRETEREADLRDVRVPDSAAAGGDAESVIFKGERWAVVGSYWMHLHLRHADGRETWADGGDCHGASTTIVR